MVTTLSSYYITDRSWSDDVYWDGRSDGIVQLLYNTSLATSWTFSGIAILTNGNQCLDLSSGGQIIVESGSTLCLSNICLKGVSGNNIRCRDASSTLILDNCELQLAGNFSFTVGSLQVVSGDINNSFSCEYSSAQPLTILPAGVLAFHKSYFGCVSSSTSSPLVFGDTTSELHLSNAHLYTFATPVLLMTGRIIIDGVSYFSNQATTQSQGLFFGDGIDPTHDCTLIIRPSATFSCTAGYFSYMNVNG